MEEEPKITPPSKSQTSTKSGIYPRNPEEEEEFQFRRDAAQITLERVTNYDELLAATKQEGDKIFIEKTRHLWTDLVVHGVVGKNKRGEPVIKSYTDLDGRCSIGIFALAGINTEHVSYVKPGEYKPGHINIDTGGREGLVIEKLRKEHPRSTVFMDHHDPKKSTGKTSATITAYKSAIVNGLLERTPQLDKLVVFVNQVDNSRYPNQDQYYPQSDRMVLGLYRFMDFEQLYPYFMAGRKPTEVLSDQDLDWLESQRKPRKTIQQKAGKEQKKPKTLRERSEGLRQIIEASRNGLEDLTKRGFVVQTERYGRIIIDIEDLGRKVPAGFNAVKGFGYDTYILWSANNQSFFVTSRNPLTDNFNPKDDPGRGQIIRQTMYQKSRHVGKSNEVVPLTITLTEILTLMTDGKFESKDELAAYLEQEKQKEYKKSIFEQLNQ